MPSSRPAAPLRRGQPALSFWGWVRIANHTDITGGRCALIAPQQQVAKLLLICRLNQRLPVFATVDDALANLTRYSQRLHRLKTRAISGSPAGAGSG